MRSLRLWAGFLVALLAVDALLQLAVWHETVQFIERVASLDAPTPAAMALPGMVEALAMASLLNSAAVIALWLVWQRVAAANVRDRVRHALRWERDRETLRADRPVPLRFTPGWSIAWWFLPVMNLWMPLRAMTEIWDRSHALDGRTRRLRWVLWVWWALVLVTAFIRPLLVLVNESSVRALGEDATPEDLADITRNMLLIITVRGFALAAFAAAIVVEVTKSQGRWPPVDEDALRAS